MISRTQTTPAGARAAAAGAGLRVVLLQTDAATGRVSVIIAG